MFAKKEEKPPAPQQSHRITEFLVLAKSARGAAVVDLVKRVTEAPGVYTFGELLSTQSIQSLTDGPDKIWHDFLELFAFGTVKSYKDRANEFPSLSPNQLQKLRHLTIVTLATRAKTISYVELQEALEISNVRELEDLIIDACYSGIIHGKLDQKRKLLEVNFSIGRDIEGGDKKEVIATLEEWCDACESLLTTLQSEIQVSNEAREAHLTHGVVVESTVAGIRANLRLQRDDVDPAELDDVLSATGRSTPTHERGSKRLSKGRLTRAGSGGVSNRWK